MKLEAPRPVVPPFVFQLRKPIRYKPRAAPDAPPTPPPPTPALVVAASADGTGQCTLTFDRPVGWTGAPPDDGSLLLGGEPPSVIYQLDATTFQFTPASPVYAGTPWQIVAQPAWLAQPVAVPQAGSL